MVEEEKQTNYAVVELGGKQFRVEEGDLLTVDRVSGEVGETIEFGRPLLVVNGGKPTIGQPSVDGAAVKAKILGHIRGKKILVFKFKRRKKYRKKRGHRQEQTKLQVESISL